MEHEDSFDDIDSEDVCRQAAELGDPQCTDPTDDEAVGGREPRDPLEWLKWRSDRERETIQKLTEILGRPH